MSNEPRPTISLAYGLPEKPPIGKSAFTILIVLMVANIGSLFADVGSLLITHGHHFVLPVYIISPILSFASLIASIPAGQRNIKLLLIIPLITGFVLTFIELLDPQCKTALEALYIGYFCYFLLAIPFTIGAFFAIRKLRSHAY